jgi:ssDNA thymidine ADP-ribosyltransferase, DarT
MALTLTQEKGLIFRITHRDNVPWILDNGMHARNGDKFDPNSRNIGNVDLTNRQAVAPCGCRAAWWHA